MSRQTKAIELALQIAGASGRPSNRKLRALARQTIQEVLVQAAVDYQGKKLALNGEPAKLTDTVKDGDKLTVTEKPENS